MAKNSPTESRTFVQSVVTAGLIVAALVIAALLVWQGVTAAGTPDPTVPHTNPLVAVLDIAALVFREGIECVVVLTAVIYTKSRHHV